MTIASEYERECLRDFLAEHRRLICMTELGLPTLRDRKLAHEIELLCGFGREACGHLARLLGEKVPILNPVSGET